MINSVTFTTSIISLMIAASPDPADRPATHDPEANVESAAMMAGEAAANAAVEEMERANRRFEQRLDVCRKAIRSRDWPKYVEQQVNANSELGEFSDHLEICMVYYQGRIDALDGLAEE